MIHDPFADGDEEEEEDEEMTLQDFIVRTVLPVGGMLLGVFGLNFAGDQLLGDDSGWPVALLGAIVLSFLYAYLGVWSNWGCECCDGMVREPPDEYDTQEERERAAKLEQARKIVVQSSYDNPLDESDTE